MRPNKKSAWVAVGAVLVLLGYLGGTYAQKKRPPAHTFLQSTAAKIQLGLWDKFDVDATNLSIFIVTGPDGNTYQTTRSESLDNWVYVTFPDDFSNYPVNASIYATYSWKCFVGGRNVAGGKFRWGNGQADDDNRNLR